MIVFEKPVPIITTMGVIRESEFSEADGWWFEIAGDTVIIGRHASVEQNIPRIPACNLRGYAISYVKENAYAPVQGIVEKDHKQEHRDGNPGGKAKGPSRRNRVQQSAGQEKEALKSDRPVAAADIKDGRDRELGRLLG